MGCSSEGRLQQNCQKIANKHFVISQTSCIVSVCLHPSQSKCRCPIPATVDAVVPISEQGSELHWQSTNLQQELQILYILSIMHILSVVRGDFFPLHRTLKCKYSKKWSRHKLETGEAQVLACSKRDYSSVISQKLQKIQQFAQKYNRHVG